MNKTPVETIRRWERIPGCYAAAAGEMLAAALPDGECCVLITKKKHILDSSTSEQMANSRPKLPDGSNQMRQTRISCVVSKGTIVVRLKYFKRKSIRDFQFLHVFRNVRGMCAIKTIKRPKKKYEAIISNNHIHAL